MSAGDISKTTPKPTNINVMLDNWCKISRACLKLFAEGLNLQINLDEVKIPSKTEDETIAKNPSEERKVTAPKELTEGMALGSIANYEAMISKMVKKVAKWVNTKTIGDIPFHQTAEGASHQVKKISQEALENKVSEALEKNTQSKVVKEEITENYLQQFPTDLSRIIDSSEMDISLKEELTESALRRKAEIRRHCVLPFCNDSISAETARDLYHEMCVHIYKEHPEIEGPLEVAKISKAIKPPVAMAGKKKARNKRLQSLLLKRISTMECFTCSTGVSVEGWLLHAQAHMRVEDPFQCPYCDMKYKKSDMKKRSCAVFIHSTDQHLPLVKNTSVTAKGKTQKIDEVVRSLDRKFQVRAFRQFARTGQPQFVKEEKRNKKSLDAGNSVECAEGNCSTIIVESSNSEGSPIKLSRKRKYSEVEAHVDHKKRWASSLPKECVVLVDVSSRPMCYTCTHCCNKQFSDDASFIEHLASNHPVCNLKCHDCLEIFKDANIHLNVCPKQLKNQEEMWDYSSEGSLVIDLDRKSSSDAGSNTGDSEKGRRETIPEMKSQEMSVAGKRGYTSQLQQKPLKTDRRESTVTESPLSMGTKEARSSPAVGSNNAKSQPQQKFIFLSKALGIKLCLERPLPPDKTAAIKQSPDSLGNLKDCRVP